MFSRRSKVVYFALEGVNAFATGYYGNYLFFLLRDRYGFGNLGNLFASALSGFVFVFAAWQGGRFAQRFGYFNALRLGFGGMALVLGLGCLTDALVAQFAVMLGWTICMCFTWPTLEALVSENESGAGLPQMIGIYNVVWSSAAAAAYFFGGAIFDHLGHRSLFWLPAGLHVAQLGVVTWLARQPKTASAAPVKAAAPTAHVPDPAAYVQPVSAKTFLRMAWLANPFAYIGINTVLATIPQLARQLQLTTTQTGWFCSIWFFARCLTFVLLWRWNGWHYRFRWLLTAFLGLMGGFAVLLLSHQLALLVLAQAVFGFSVGLLYYSSLFYSMDVGETKGEHGGLHEAMIGTGICLGPTVGATALYLAPQSPGVGAYAVGGLLGLGLLALVGLWLRRTA